MFDLTSPTPLASLLSGLLTLAGLAALYALLQWVRGRRDRKAPSVGDRTDELTNYYLDFKEID